MPMNERPVPGCGKAAMNVRLGVLRAEVRMLNVTALDRKRLAQGITYFVAITFLRRLTSGSQLSPSITPSAHMQVSDWLGAL